MNPSATGRTDQVIDPAVVEWASIFTYWAIVGIATIIDVVAVDTAIALALAPIGLLLIEAVAKRVAARLAQ